jgi:uncharacterized membrane protein YdjX (TVP38/TMEM64 family)
VEDAQEIKNNKGQGDYGVRALIRFTLGILFMVIFVAVRFFALNEYMSFALIQHHSAYLQQITHEHYLLSVGIFISFYAAAVFVALPLSALMTMLSGFLFGALPGTIYSNIGATIGAIGSFFLVRYCVGQWIQERYEAPLRRFNEAMHSYGALFLVFVHFIAVIPFFLINILAGMTRVPWQTFVWTTSVGIIPGSLVYAFAGQQLGNIHHLSDIFSFYVILAFVFLGVLATAPLILQRMSVLHFLQK